MFVDDIAQFPMDTVTFTVRNKQGIAFGASKRSTKREKRKCGILRVSKVIHALHDKCRNMKYRTFPFFSFCRSL